MKQFSKQDKKHLKRQICTTGMFLKDFKKEDLLDLLYLQNIRVGADYLYWKEKLKNINKQLISLKQLKTNLLVTTVPKMYTIDSQTVTEKLFWYRNLYLKVLAEYKKAKLDYKFTQGLYTRQQQEEKADRLEAKRFVGKFLYKLLFYYGKRIEEIYIRSDKEFSEENLRAEVKEFKDSLEDFNWLAYWTLSRNLDIYKFTITEVHEPVDSKDILIDFAEFHAWRTKARLEEFQRITFDEFVATKEDEVAKFSKWLIEEVGCIPVKWTRQRWEKFYNMFKSNEKLSDRRTKLGTS